MAYTAGDQILDDEYNNFVGSSSSPFGINHISGTGSAEYGLGESSVATVSAGDTINASQWNTLFAAMNVCAAHTADSITSTGSKSAGDAIAIISALTTDLATLAASVAAGSPNTTAVTTSSALQQPTSSSTWSNSFTTEMSVTFASADKMRHFFNAGGKIRITFGTSQSSTSPKDQAYIDLGTALGNLDIAALASTRSGSGETLTTDGLARGFHDLTDSYQTIIKLTSDNSNYTSNNIEVFAKLNAAVGSATVITVKVVATDGASDTQFTAGNTSSIAADIKNTPKIVTTLFSIDPNTDQGLGTGHAPASTATVSNTTS